MKEPMENTPNEHVLRTTTYRAGFFPIHIVMISLLISKITDYATGEKG